MQHHFKLKFFLESKAPQHNNDSNVHVAHQVDMFLTTEYTLLELEYKQGKYVSPRLGIDFSHKCRHSKENMEKCYAKPVAVGACFDVPLLAVLLRSKGLAQPTKHSNFLKVIPAPTETQIILRLRRKALAQ